MDWVVASFINLPANRKLYNYSHKVALTLDDQHPTKPCNRDSIGLPSQPIGQPGVQGHDK